MLKPIVALLLLEACVVTTTRQYGRNPGPPPGQPGEGSQPPTHTNSQAGPPPAVAANPDAPFVGSDSHTQAGEHPPSDRKLCDGAHDHCLPQGSTFATEWAGGIASEYVYVAMKIDRGLWAWVRSDIVRGPEIRGVDTERATTANMKPGIVAVGFLTGGSIPQSEADAVAGRWQIGTVTSVDRATATFHLEGAHDDIPIIAGRVVKGFYVPPHE